MSEHSVTHGTFVVERVYDASPARVFAAWSDPVAKTRWFNGTEKAAGTSMDLDFTIGGIERTSGGREGGRDKRRSVIPGHCGRYARCGNGIEECHVLLGGKGQRDVLRPS